MSAVLVVAKMHTLSGILTDYSQNSWAFEDGGEADPVATAGLAFTKLESFYTAVGSLYAPSVSRVANVHTLEAYDLAAELETPGAGLGSPIAGATFSIAEAAAAQSLPSEVALVMSFHASLIGAPVEVGITRPRSRRTGRVYLGPLSVGATADTSPNHEARPTAGTITTISNAGAAMVGPTGAAWSVWSRKDNVLRLVDGGWVDNAFDTQRRRGVDPTTRTNFGLLT